MASSLFFCEEVGVEHMQKVIHFARCAIREWNDSIYICFAATSQRRVDAP